jgi:hypothetical protein
VCRRQAARGAAAVVEWPNGLVGRRSQPEMRCTPYPAIRLLHLPRCCYVTHYSSWWLALPRASHPLQTTLPGMVHESTHQPPLLLCTLRKSGESRGHIFCQDGSVTVVLYRCHLLLHNGANGTLEDENKAKYAR